MLKDKGVKLDRHQVAHFVKNYVIDIGKISEGPNMDVETCDEVQTDNELWSPDNFSLSEVLKVVKGINVSKSSGLHDISSFIIMEAFTILIMQVTFMCNLSL